MRSSGPGRFPEGPEKNRMSARRIKLRSGPGRRSGGPWTSRMKNCGGRRGAPLSRWPTWRGAGPDFGVPVARGPDLGAGGGCRPHAAGGHGPRARGGGAGVGAAVVDHEEPSRREPESSRGGRSWSCSARRAPRPARSTRSWTGRGTRSGRGEVRCHPHPHRRRDGEPVGAHHRRGATRAAPWLPATRRGSSTTGA